MKAKYSELRDKGTQGSLSSILYEHGHGLIAEDESGFTEIADCMTETDARLIAHEHNHFPALLAELSAIMPFCSLDGVPRQRIEAVIAAASEVAE